MREGCVFLADEFNLLSSSVMLGLIPFLSSSPGEIVGSNIVPTELKISFGFLFIATGNEDTEKGRMRLPMYVKKLFRIVEVLHFF
jgi:MoxR-like ATPase